ncbi:DUF1365 domain-containing protein [Paenarthrobacter sp. DKR-5]|uniref:DUF1365 domain-containing protein n=1 Tax=Paenarthrobacter sp. DKR-5 TaxID=2835535 RepID=UPI0027DB0C04|nr:DUF1365 domain-containing protein [Paenarthrobacter sp. DKR-5]
MLPWYLRPLAGFQSRDHLGSPDRSIRQNVDAFLATRGVDLAGGRVTMLANARVLGYVFNPLSLFWCHGPDGDLRCVVAEVHNTYGERHCYLLETDDAGRARTAKELYVSPFNDVDGEYAMRLPEPADRLGIAVVLERDGKPPFIATMDGRAQPATPVAVLRNAVAVPLAPLLVSFQIRAQGIKLWARRLPVRPRPTHDPQEAVQ